MKLWNIARQGMKGRKRDTRLLLAVVALAFAFITAASVLLASIDRTKQEQQFALYGRWQLMAAEADTARKQAIENTKGVDAFAASELLFTAENCGVIGSIDDAFAMLGSLRLIEGRLPSAKNEIVIEAGQLAKLKTPLGVGDSIQVSHKYFFDYKPTEEEVEAQKRAREEEMKEYQLRWQQYGIEPVLEFLADLPAEERARYDEEFTQWFAEEGAEFNRIGLNGVWSQTEDIIRDAHTLLELYPDTYNDILTHWMFYEREDKRAYDYIIGYYNEQYRKWNNTLHTRQVNDLLFLGDINMLVCVQQQGYAYNPQARPISTVFQMKYVITGIVESYSDRWDSSVYSLPNAFISQSGALEFAQAYEAVRARYERTPAYAPAHIVLAASHALDARELYAACYPAFMELADKQKAAYQIIGYLESGMVISFREVSGYLYGLDADTKEPVYIPFSGYASADESGVSFTYRDVGYSFSVEELLSGSIYVAGLEPPPISESLAAPDRLDDQGTSTLRVNTYSYPPAVSRERTLVLIVTGIIIVTTACAVFQIYLTQMKRRTRRLALLKSIGATNRQVLSMFAIEVAYLLLLALPLGFALGMGVAYASVRLLPAQGAQGALVFFIDWQPLLLGLGCGVLALIAGALFPVLRAVKTPLVGAVSGQKKTKAVRRVQTKQTAVQSFAAIQRRHIKANPGRTRGNFALAAFTIAIALICIFLCFNAFEHFNTAVMKNRKPDYRIDAGFGMNIRFLDEVLEDMAGRGELARIEPLKAAENVYLSFDGLENSPILNALDKAAPADLRARLFAERVEEMLAGPEGAATSAENEAPAPWYVTNIYGLRSSDTLFAHFNEALTEGSVDPERFDAGEEVILLVPMYKNGSATPDDAQFTDAASLRDVPGLELASTLLRKTNVMDLSFSKGKAAYYKTDDAVRVGDTLNLAAQTVVVDAVTQTKSTHMRQKSVTVAAIVRYFPDTGIWPFSDANTPYAVISGLRVPGELYDHSELRLDADGARRLEAMAKVFFPDSRGKTYFYIYGTGEATRENTDLPLLSFAREYGLKLNNYRETNEAMYNEAFNNAFIMALLGITAAMIALTILSSTLESTAEQERARTGVLQSMGVTGRQFLGSQRRGALRAGIIAFFVANGCLALTVAIFALVKNSGLGLSPADLMHAALDSLWLYPWQAHLGVSALFLIILTTLYTRPTRKILKYSPIENIRS